MAGAQFVKKKPDVVSALRPAFFIQYLESCISRLNVILRHNLTLSVDEPDNAAKAAELEQWGRSIILLFPDETAYAKYAASPAASLPQTVTFGIDRDGSIRRQILDAMHLPGNVPLPVFIVGDTFNRVVFESHGYTIGLGDRFLHTIHQL